MKFKRKRTLTPSVALILRFAQNTRHLPLGGRLGSVLLESKENSQSIVRKTREAARSDTENSRSEFFLSEGGEDVGFAKSKTFASRSLCTATAVHPYKAYFLRRRYSLRVNSF